MLSMPGAAVDTAQAGRRVRTNVLLALSLSSIIPLLVLAYTINQYALPRLERVDSAATLALQALLLFTLLGVVAGGWLIWKLGRTVMRMHQLMARDPSSALLDTRGDDLSSRAICKPCWQRSSARPPRSTPRRRVSTPPTGNSSRRRRA
jgi:hypothetical protein